MSTLEFFIMLYVAIILFYLMAVLAFHIIYALYNIKDAIRGWKSAFNKIKKCLKK